MFYYIMLGIREALTTEMERHLMKLYYYKSLNERGRRFPTYHCYRMQLKVQAKSRNARVCMHALKKYSI